MANELLIEGLRITHGDGSGPIVVDAIVETDFGGFGAEASDLPISDVCLAIEQLAEGESTMSLETVAAHLVDSLMEQFPGIEGIELTLRLLDPPLQGIQADAIGVRKRRRRPKPPQRLPRREIKPLPR